MYNSEKFRYKYDLSGTDRPTIISLPIASATVIERGERVKLVSAKIVSASDTEACIGISADPHDGSSEGQDGTTIRVYASPTAIYACRPAYLAVADAGSGSNSFIDATLVAHSDDAFNGGHLKAVACDNVATDTIIEITDFNGTTGEITVASGDTFATDDTATLFPPVGSTVMGVDSDGTNLALDEIGTALIVVKVDLDLEIVYVMSLKHQFAGSLS